MIKEYSEFKTKFNFIIMVFNIVSLSCYNQNKGTFMKTKITHLIQLKSKDERM